MPSTGIDPYFYKQPPFLFIEELKKPVHTEKPSWFQSRQPAADEVSAAGAYLADGFPDPEGVLETAREDFTRFLRIYQMDGTRFPIRLKKVPTECFEAYRILVDASGCTVEAADTEGIRRGLIYLEDELHRRSGPVLPTGTVSRKPYIRERITRGFFSPTNRPPKNIDELMDDVDYYPDEYLNRLAHDGTNGLWIYTHFSKLLPSAYFKEFGTDSDRRLNKLRQVVKKCKRYGVKVWVFGVEPQALMGEIAEHHKDVFDTVNAFGQHTFCTHTEQGANYCIEVTQRLMEAVPDLGGIIDITYGERTTTCASLSDISRCPRCRRYSRSEILAHNLNLFKEGIRRAGSNADFVSWTYAHCLSQNDEIREYVEKAPADVMLQENFEDNGYVEQLGKLRRAHDYWLSYTGPSQMFLAAAETAVRTGKQMFAKMQVCCSHEVATVPYVPVPGILYDKYAAARQLNVKGVMQCWYFGNYPSMMSKAAGELSFWDEFTSKEDFLKYLAGIYFGSEADQAVQMWNCFADGYQNYPVNIMFSYYGPMHDGVVWDLALEPRNTSLPRTWQLLDKPDGDRIGECLQAGHTLDEAVILCDRMKTLWQQGIDCMPANCPDEQRTAAQCLNLLFTSGHRILRFYQLRGQLSKNPANALALLDQMEQLVREEMQASADMIPLCEQDSRLGYHSEAEGFKFFPEKLRDRIGKLQTLLDTEFPRVRARVRSGQTALPWFEGKDGPGCDMAYGDLEKADFQKIAENGQFRTAYDEKNIYIELQGNPGTAFRMHFAYDPMWPMPGVIIQNGEKTLPYYATVHQCIWGEGIQKEKDKYRFLLSDPENAHYIIAIDRETVGWTEDTPLQMMIATGMDQSEGINDRWITEEDPVHTLGKGDISPGEFGWLRPAGNAR